MKKIFLIFSLTGCATTQTKEKPEIIYCYLPTIGIEVACSDVSIEECGVLLQQCDDEMIHLCQHSVSCAKAPGLFPPMGD
jgi:hypothetical protein